MAFMKFTKILSGILAAALGVQLVALLGGHQLQLGGLGAEHLQRIGVVIDLLGLGVAILKSTSA